MQSVHCATTYHDHIFTGRNEVVAKVIFLHLSFILFTGRVCASVHAGIPHLPEQTCPPGADTPPPPPGKQTPAYGQLAAGMQPTGMHSCLLMNLLPTFRTEQCLFLQNNQTRGYKLTFNLKPHYLTHIDQLLRGLLTTGMS